MFRNKELLQRIENLERRVRDQDSEILSLHKAFSRLEMRQYYRDKGNGNEQTTDKDSVRLVDRPTGTNNDLPSGGRN